MGRAGALSALPGIQPRSARIEGEVRNAARVLMGQGVREPDHIMVDPGLVPVAADTSGLSTGPSARWSSWIGTLDALLTHCSI